MKLPLAVSLARLGNLPSTICRFAPRILTAGFALTLILGLLIPAAKLHAQSENSERIHQDNGLQNGPLAEDSVADSASPTVVLISTTIQAPGEHTTASGAIVTTSKNGYAGTVNYTCALTTKTNTETPPMCAMYPAQETLVENGKAEPMMLIFGKGTHLPPGVTEGRNAGSSFRWMGTGGAILACCLLFGIPARRRRSWAILPVLLLAAVGGFSGCAEVPQMMTAGQYSFKVTATDSKDAKITSSVAIPVVVL
jgi:hypothetical protein